MSSSRSDRLRNRLSIDPDAIPEQAPAPAPRPVRARPVKVAPPVEPAPEPEVIDEPAKAADEAAEGETEEDGAYFRSFYVSNDTYARFRAAVFWSSRNPQAVDTAPENMSVAVEDALLKIATDLEKQFNAGDRFPDPPKTRRRRSKKK